MDSTPQPPINTPLHKKPVAKILGAVGLLIVAGVIILIARVLTSQKTLDQSSAPVLQSNTVNTAQKNDVSVVASAVAGYADAHNGILPSSTATDPTAGTLDICGTDCTSGDKVTVHLDYFSNTPDAVQFHPYVSGLTAPNVKTLYIVSNASCKSDGSGLQAATSRSAAFLYAYTSGSSLAQQCLGL